MSAPDIADCMKRREFILLFASAVGSPLATVAQQRASTPRLGVLVNLASDDPEGQERMAAFRTSLKELGWEADQNIVIDYRWAAGVIEHVRASASELVRLAPNILLVSGTTAFVAIRDQTQTIPIVFVNVAEQTVMRFAGSLARPAGNAIGFAATAFPDKYLEALREVAPSIARVALIADPDNPASAAGTRAIETVAKSLGVQVREYAPRGAEEIKRAVEAFAGEPKKGGLIVLPSPMAAVHRDQIIMLAGLHHLPAVYPYRYFAAMGGLLSYGVDLVDQHRRAASYVDRILKGHKVTELPVQEPTKFELVINLKTAKALGLTVPLKLLARADEVIE